MFCGCTGLGHGEDMMYVTDKIPAHFTIMQRIKRWAQLVKFHPLLNQFNAEMFVENLPKSFVKDLKVTQPVIQSLMDQYKEEKLHETCETLGMKAPEGYE